MLFLLATDPSEVQAQVCLLASSCWHSNSGFWPNGASHLKRRDWSVCKSQNICLVLVHFSVLVFSLSISNRNHAGWWMTKVVWMHSAWARVFVAARWRQRVFRTLKTGETTWGWHLGASWCNQYTYMHDFGQWVTLRLGGNPHGHGVNMENSA